METLFVALRVVVALAAVLGLIWVVQRRLTKGAGTPKKGSIASRFSAPKRAIQVLGSHRLTAKSSITVVEIDGVKMVLGVTEHGISVLEPAKTPTATPVAVTIAHPEAIATPGSEPTQLAASAEETLASADVREAAPVDFAAVFREALDEAAAEPQLSTVVEQHPVDVAEDAAPKRRRRMAVPALGEQLLPHMTRTLAGAIGLRLAEPETPAASVAPVAAQPAVAAPRPAASRSALAAFLENSAPSAPEAPAAPAAPAAKDYSKATPLAANLPVLQRAS